ncbi:MAG: AraC family transcriptional regulator [Chthoniobacterales bacterium]|nr:AraC family transcriptional regulator [Chthoniobacterales bacterium]
MKRLDKKADPELDAMLAIAVTAFAYIPDVWFFAKDTNGKFVAANPPFLKLCGLQDLSDLLGKTDLDFFHKKRAHLYIHDDRKVMETGVKLENQIEPMPRGKFKSDLMITNKFAIKSADGRILGIVGVSRNLSETSARSADAGEFAKTINHIERLSRERFDLRALASNQGMSTAVFERRFKKIFHMTPVAYHQQVRLRHARHELLASAKSVGEIAAEFGFYDQSHFTKSFGAAYGMPPLRFRKSAMVPLAAETGS